MDIIYLDTLFLLNLGINYLLCLLSARVCGVVLRRRRYFLAAILGAVYSCAMYIPALTFLRLNGLKLILWLLMALCAFGCEDRLLACAVVFAAVSAAFAGFILAIQLAGGYPSFDFRTMFLSFALCYMLLHLFLGRKLKQAGTKHVRVELEFAGKHVEFMALVDTGNQLSDPISGHPVMVVSPHAVADLFEEWKDFLRLSPIEMMEKAAATGALRGRFRLIPYTALGGHGLLCAFRPDRVSSEGVCPELLVAISQDAHGDGFEAIL